MYYKGLYCTKVLKSDFTYIFGKLLTTDLYTQGLTQDYSRAQLIRTGNARENHANYPSKAFWHRQKI